MDRPVDLAVLRDLYSWGADTLENFQSRVGATATAELVLDGTIKLLQGNTFTFVALGREGRRKLGLHLNYNHQIRARSAVMHIMRREAKAKLEQLGMTYVGAEDRVLRRFENAEQRTYFLAVSDKGESPGHTARAVRRLLNRYKGLLLQTQGVLVIATPTPGRLSKMVAKNELFLKTLKVDGRLIKAGTSSK